MEFCDNNIKYIVPFDSVDLSLLPNFNILPKFKENIMPLWDTNNLQQRNEDCYYEFEIIPKEDSTEGDTYCSSEVSENSPNMETEIEEPTLSTHMCYICNIDVPAVCMNEHLMSTKHKTFLKIADISLERVRKQMSTNYKSEILPMGFAFCDTCTTLIPEEDVFSHVKLKPHKNAELVDKLLRDLLKIYSDSEVDNDDDSANVSKLETSRSSKDSEKVENVGGPKRRNVPDGSTKSNEVAFKTVDKVDSAKITAGGDKLRRNVDKNITGNCKLTLGTGEIITSVDRLNSAKISKVNGDLNAYTGTTKGCTMASGPAKGNVGDGKSNGLASVHDTVDDIPHDSVEIINWERGKVEEIPCVPVIKDFSKKIMSKIDGGLNDYIRCHLDNVDYKVEVGKDDDLVIGVPSGRRVRVSLANFHGLCSLGKRQVLCFICEKMDRNLKKHIYSVNHLNNIRLPIDKNFTREYADGKSHCILCNDTIAYPSIHAMCSVDHDTNLKLALVDEQTDRTDKSDSFAQEAPATRKTEFEDTINTVSGETVNGSVITRSYSEATKETRKPSVELGRVGPAHASGSPEEMHNPANCKSVSQSPDHKSNAALLPHHLLEHSSTSGTLKCKVCLTDLSLDDAVQHVSSTVHQNNYRKLLAVNTMARVGSKVYCSTCVHYVEVDEELAHLNSGKHKSLIINTLVYYEMKMDAEEKATIKPHYCKVCLVNVPGDGKNIKTHEDGARHKKNVALAEAKDVEEKAVINQDRASPVAQIEHGNLIRVTAKFSEVVCRICSTILPNTPKNIREHINGNNHKNKVSSLEMDSIKLYRDIYWCSRCETQVPMGEQFLHKDSATHAGKNAVKEGTDEEKGTPKEPNIIKPFHLNMLKPTDNKGALSCQVCDVAVPNSGSTLRMHFEGVKHRSQVMKLIKANGLDGAGLSDEFNCTICLCRFPSDELLDHIELAQHVAGLGASATPAESKAQSEKKGQEATVKSKNGQKEQTEKSKANQNGMKVDVESKSVEQDQEGAKVKADPNPEGVKPKTEDCLCVVCNVLLTTNETNINLHKDGLRHKTNLTIMEQNKIRVLEAGFYCEACDTKFERDLLLKHVAGPQHLVMLG